MVIAARRYVSIGLRGWVVLIAMMLAAMVIPATDAVAAPCGAPVDPTISVTPAQGPPGTRVTISGRAPVGNRVLVDGLGPQGELAGVPASGVYSIDLTVPADAAP